MIYLYGLLDPQAQVDLSDFDCPAGVTGPNEIETLEYGHLIYGHHDGGEILAKRRFLLVHARVLEPFQNLGCVLPMPFGMLAESIGEVAQLVQRQSSLIGPEFDRLRCLVAYGVRISFDRKVALNEQLERHPELQRESARLHSARRKNQMQQAEFGRRLGARLDEHRTETQRSLSNKLRAFVSDMVLRAPDDDAQVIAADLLIESHQVGTLENDLLALAGACGFGGGSEPSIRLVGPVPPYSFVRLSLAKHSEVAA